MRTIAAIFLCGALAACSQTGAAPAPSGAKTAQPAASPGAQHAAATGCEEAIRKAQQQSTNAAMLGGALSMVGGLGGFGGRGGAVAAQAVSMGGSLVRNKAQGDAQSAMQQECLS